MVEIIDISRSSNKTLSNQTINIDEINNNSDSYPEPTELRVSTITAVAKTNFNLDLKKMFDNIQDDQLISEDSQKEGVIKIKYGNILKVKNNSPNNNSNVNNSKKTFYNQITSLILIKRDHFFKVINVKIFNNGILQLTGLRKFEEGTYCIKLLIDFINNLHNKEIFLSYKDDSTYPRFFDYEIVLINSDYSTRFKIKRETLYEILLEKYNMYVTYEPCIYQGVNSKYFWNEEYKNFPNKGICFCRSNCIGKGKGNGDGNCKKITIAVFQSGKVIITGARTFEQISCAYIFINNVFKTYFKEIKRNNISMDLINNKKDELNDNSPKSYFLKKNSIIFKGQNIFYFKMLTP